MILISAKLERNSLQNKNRQIFFALTLAFFAKAFADRGTQHPLFWEKENEVACLLSFCGLFPYLLYINMLFLHQSSKCKRMEKQKLGIIAVLCMMMGCAPQPKTELIYVEGEQIEGTTNAVHEILVCNPPKGLDWTIWGQFQLAYELPGYATEDSDLDFTNVDALCYTLTPRREGDTLHLRFMDKYLYSHSRIPMGFYLQCPGKESVELPITYHFLPVDSAASAVYQKASLALTDIVPQIKKVQMLEGETPSEVVRTVLVQGRKPSWYRITVKDSVLVEAADEDGAYYAGVTLDKIHGNVGSDTLPNMILEDWPDFPVRPLMLDLGRNFLTVEQVCEIIDVMARNKSNVLMLHLAEDEGWRLEIKGLPELTEYGAFHAIPEKQADGTYAYVNGLMPSQNGRVGREKPWESATGYYTREEYKQILRYAAERHIEVLPELELPGHSGSAIEAMRHRARTTGDESFLLTSKNDKSKHVAVYGYKDNIVDVSLPATYKFLGVVLDDLIDIYKEAGLKLERVNISGDEVPDGCWLESPEARELLKQNGWTSAADLWAYFIGKVVDMYAERGLKLVAYDVAMDAPHQDVVEKVRQNVSFLITWIPSTRGNGEYVRKAYRLSESGVPMLLSHADYTYMDNQYVDNRTEQGLRWAGATDERKAYSYNPYDIKGEGLQLKHPENILGVEPMLWGDNVYTYEQACYLLFPKVYGLFERSWNAVADNSDETFGKFYSIVVERELPFIESKGMNHRKPMIGETRN